MNQRDEQRVIEALQAFTGGLIVTENDMLIAGRNLKDNLEPPAPGVGWPWWPWPPPHSLPAS